MLAAALIAGACTPEPVQREGDTRVRVVATTGMIADVAARIGGDRVVVESLMGPGVDPHLYKASAGDVRRLSRAALVLYNGLHLEAAMGEVLEEMGQRKHTVAVTEWIDRSALTAPPEYQGNYDPHVWFDVRLWMRAVQRIEAAYVRADSQHAAGYAERAAAVLSDLAVLDAWVRERASEIPPERRVLVTAHDAFGYFGRAYGFEVRGLQGISTASEAGTADVQQLAAEIARRRIPAIFVETSIPRRTIEAVQAAVLSRGFEVAIGGALYSDALGDPGTPAGTYVGMVRSNVETIVAALNSDAATMTVSERDERTEGRSAVIVLERQ
ncbi:MAG: zinc ABC transporter substrate-binding protein [Gemmatimonadetes bacterium]|nr:zinc ABC transporter substrate-binding protein [Gemmatimonadota bacterium]